MTPEKWMKAAGTVVAISAVISAGAFSAKATPPSNISFAPVSRATLPQFDVKRKDKAADFEIRLEAPQAMDVATQVVTFQPGGSIPFAETHVMEHGLFVLEGKAVYRLNQDWVEVEAGDFMWLRAFCPQACYAGGPGRFRYLLYKDVNRHATLSRQFV